jgi:hypothetical protein
MTVDLRIAILLLPLLLVPSSLHAGSIFRTALRYSSGGRYAVAVAAADVNGDGHPDLVVAHSPVKVQLGHLPKHDDRSSRAWLHGKLLVALPAQKLIRIGRDISP